MKFKLLAGAASGGVAASAPLRRIGWYGAADLGYHWRKHQGRLRKPRCQRHQVYLALQPGRRLHGVHSPGLSGHRHWRVERGRHRPGTSIGPRRHQPGVPGLCRFNVVARRCADLAGAPRQDRPDRHGQCHLRHRPRLDDQRSLAPASASITGADHRRPSANVTACHHQAGANRRSRTCTSTALHGLRGNCLAGASYKATDPED